jgi:hypothetical protein
MKNKKVAAALNLLPGLGYLYLGRRRVFAALLIASTVFGLIGVFDPAFLEAEDTYVSTWYLITSLVSFVAVEAAFVYDAYQEAVRMQHPKK